MDLKDGCVVQEILAPSAFLGRSLRDMKIRDRTGVQVVLIRGLAREDQPPSIRIPGPADRIESGDELLVAGTKEASDRISNLWQDEPKRILDGARMPPPGTAYLVKRSNVAWSKS